MFCNGFDFKVNDSMLNQNGPYIVLDWTLVCLYSYNDDKPGLLNEILQKFERFVHTIFLFCGDWNVVHNKTDNTYNVIHEKNRNTGTTQEIKETFELWDSWKICHFVDKSAHGVKSLILSKAGLKTWVFLRKFADNITIKEWN